MYSIYNWKEIFRLGVRNLIAVSVLTTLALFPVMWVLVVFHGTRVQEKILAQNYPNLLGISQPAPAGVTSSGATTVGQQGQATYYYWVISIGAAGGVPPQQPAFLNNAPNQLNNTNKVNIFWNNVSWATSYAVLRTPGPNFPGFNCSSCAVATGITGNSTTDTGSALSSFSTSTIGSATATLSLNNTSFARPRLSWDTPFNQTTIYTLCFGDGTCMTTAPSGGGSILPCTVSGGGTLTCPGDADFSGNANFSGNGIFAGFGQFGTVGTPGEVQFFDNGGSNFWGLIAPSSVGTSYLLQGVNAPPTNGTGSGQVWACTAPSGGISVCSFVTPGTGTVTNTVGSLTANAPIFGNGTNDIFSGTPTIKIFTDGGSGTILCANASDTGCTLATAGQTAFSGVFGSQTFPGAAFGANKVLRLTTCYQVTTSAATPATLNLSLNLAGVKVQTTSSLAPTAGTAQSHFCATWIAQSAAAPSSSSAVWASMSLTGPAGWNAIASAGLTSQSNNINTSTTNVAISFTGVYGGTLTQTGNKCAMEQMIVEGPF